jgi:hypothetical protein
MLIIDTEFIKKNMLINLARDYVTIKNVSSVGVILDCSTNILDINCINGMCGSTFSINLSKILKIKDLGTAIDTLINTIDAEIDN